MPITPVETKDWTIYKITNPLGRVYVGISSQFERRIKYYRYGICQSQQIILSSIKKYGFNTHSVEILETFHSEKKYAFGKEMFWIRTFMSNYGKFKEQKGMNLTNGGEGQIGLKHTEAAKEKNRQSKLGKKASEETKMKMSITRTGKKLNRTYTEEQRLKMSEHGKRLKHTEETKKKIGEASRGNKYSVGIKQSQETIEKRRKFMIGNKFGKGPSENNKKAIREAAIKNRKKVNQYDLNGALVAEYLSANDASEGSKMPIGTIRAILCGQFDKMKGFTFKYNNNVV